MKGLLLVLIVVAWLGFIGWSIWWQSRVVAELSRRPEKEFEVAGIDRVAALQRQNLWGLGPIRMAHLRRRLDQAAADIARFEQQQ